MSWILIADDHKGTCEGLTFALKAKGHSAQIALDGETAVNVVKSRFFDLAIVDIRMPKLNGIEVLETIKRLSPETIVIMMTAYATIDVAVEAMQKGASDFITKPYTLEQVELKVEKALQQRQVNMENQYLREEMEFEYNFGEIIGESPKMQKVYSIIQKVAPTNSTVLILGESGTGKELVARAIHRYSRRKEQPFIKVNCAALAEGVLESELFGHEKGAFTNAIRQKPGRFELANSGTLFLDEVGDIPLPTQSKLLRALEEQEFERVGGVKTIQVDVRLVAATHRNLAELIEKGKFRDDLFYRLNVVSIRVPPLRERQEDTPLLAAHFLKKYSAQMGKTINGVHPEAMEMLLNYPWPGNVRELENSIERAVVLTRGDVLTPEDFSLGISPYASPAPAASSEGMNLVETVEALEKRLLRKAYLEAGGNKAAAAKMLGIERSTFRYKFSKYGLDKLDE